jgi:hypothetical protein
VDVTEVVARVRAHLAGKYHGKRIPKSHIVWFGDMEAIEKCRDLTPDDLSALCDAAVLTIGERSELAFLRADNARLLESNRRLMTMFEEEAHHRMNADADAEKWRKVVALVREETELTIVVREGNDFDAARGVSDAS